MKAPRHTHFFKTVKFALRLAAFKFSRIFSLICSQIQKFNISLDARQKLVLWNFPLSKLVEQTTTVHGA